MDLPFLMKASLSLFLIINLHSSVLGESMRVMTADKLSEVLITASEGDTIYLSSGIYTGNFEITVAISLIGEADGSSILDGAGEGSVLIISADKVLVENLTIRNSGTRLLKDHAGIKITGNHVEVSGCRIIDNLHSIYVKGGNSVYIRDNTVIGRSELDEADRGNGIHLWNSRGNIIENNNVSGARDGIYLSFANSTLIKGNYIHELRYGLHYMYSDTNIFEDNLFENNVAGGAIMYSENIEFTRNIFAHHRGFRAYGIIFQSVKHMKAKNNLFLDNTKGMFFEASSFNTIENNEILQNDIAIQISGSSEENLFLENNFVSNLSNVLMSASAYGISWEKDGRGNYWSDYNGYDLDDDEIGDNPHPLSHVFEYLESREPAIRLYLYSPASLLLSAAEKQFPVLQKKVVEDPNPLYRLMVNEGVPWENLSIYEPEHVKEAVLIWLVVLSLPALMIRRIKR